ncbi:MAG TPA: flavoprotein [Elusimicrobiota bacterium]|nr:flavoprotein [Elusimicrobiota bacterium]
MILLGVTGSIAAYKAAEIVRLLVKAGEDVHIIMTAAATRFVGPLTFQALSGHPVSTDLLDPSAWTMAHLELTEKASAVLVAPATADCLARLAAGGAGDIVSASVLALPRNPGGKLKTPVWLAPAMHEAMWRHPATAGHVKTLKGYGYRFIGPDRGPLSRPDDAGDGRLSEPRVIVETVLKGR